MKGTWSIIQFQLRHSIECDLLEIGTRLDTKNFNSSTHKECDVPSSSLDLPLEDFNSCTYKKCDMFPVNVVGKGKYFNSSTHKKCDLEEISSSLNYINFNSRTLKYATLSYVNRANLDKFQLMHLLKMGYDNNAVDALSYYFQLMHS